jgi:NAD dependent epimerase/dehydratase family enzyme
VPLPGWYLNWLLELGAWLMRTETELVVKSRRVIPRRLLEEGYVFKVDDFTTMLKRIKQA